MILATQCAWRAAILPVTTAGVDAGQIEKRDEAIADFTRAIDLEPENPIFFHNRGFATGTSVNTILQSD